MSDVDNAFTQATDDLLTLYRNIERRTLDLPAVSFMPILIFFWSILKFYFFFVVGIILIVPTNLVILIRNAFPGHWGYRPFFLRYLYYAWLRIWRGEAPTAPIIFVRPLLRAFMKRHFERRLRRLRLEVLFRDDLSDATRSTLLARLDAALERWKLPRLSTAFFTVLLPGIIAFPSWYKQSSDFVGSLGVRVPTDALGGFVFNISPGILGSFGTLALIYAIAIPTTCFVAKRGLLLGGNSTRICFPGGQEGVGDYLKEREILSKVGLHTRELPIDLLLVGISSAISMFFMIVGWRSYIDWIMAHNPLRGHSALEAELYRQWDLAYKTNIVTFVVVVGLCFFAMVRRKSNGRV